MSCFDKEHYKTLKRDAKAENTLTHSVDLTDECLSYNGFSFAFTESRENLRMIQVAVSYCSPEDKFKPKHGKYQALIRLFSGRAIPLPLGGYTNEEIVAILSEMFKVY